MEQGFGRLPSGWRGGGEGESIVATDGDLHGLIYLLCEVATNKYIAGPLSGREAKDGHLIG